MSVKLIILSIAVFFCLYVAAGTDVSSNSPATIGKQLTEKQDKSDEIVLQGMLSSEEPNRRYPGQALSAYLLDDIIQVDFHLDVGLVQITITNEKGNTIYSEVVDSSIGQEIIYFSTLSTGIYSLTFDNGNSTMWGEFEINGM